MHFLVLPTRLFSPLWASSIKLSAYLQRRTAFRRILAMENQNISFSIFTTGRTFARSRQFLFAQRFHHLRSRINIHGAFDVSSLEFERIPKRTINPCESDSILQFHSPFQLRRYKPAIDDRKRTHVVAEISVHQFSQSVTVDVFQVGRVGFAQHQR